MGYLTAMMGVTEPRRPGEARRLPSTARAEIFEAVEQALGTPKPLSEHGVEGLSLSVRDCYVDQTRRYVGHGRHHGGHRPRRLLNTMDEIARG